MLLRGSVLLLATLALAAGCDGGSDGSASGGAGGAETGGAGGNGGGSTGGAGGAGGSAAGGTGGTGGTGGATTGPSVTGTLQDEAGAPVANAVVLCCSAMVCYSDSSDGFGAFHFSFAAALPVHFVVKSLEDAETTPRRAATMYPLHITDTTPLDLGALLLPSLPEGAKLGPESSDPQTLDVGDGLELTLNRADLVPPLGGSLHDIAARRIPLEHVPPLPELGTEEIMSVYALYPFATTSESPIGVRAPSDLPAGTPVHFRSISELHGKLSAPVAGQADGTHVETAGLAGLDELTWIVISR